MTRLMIDIGKTPEQNAGTYFEKAKKSKKKLEGALLALERSRKLLEKAERLREAEESAGKEAPVQKKEWYEKFRWFFSSEGFLVIGGRDATSNEIVIKKHTSKDDIVFHTDMAGSPFFVIKTEGKVPGEKTMHEAADATASYSRGWGKGLATLSVFHVRPEQVSKTARSGESLAKGSFMIYGKTTYIDNSMRVAIGMKDGRLIGGPVDSVRSRTGKYVEIVQGDGKASDAAKRIRKMIGGSLDDIIRFLPAGGCRVLEKQ